MKILICEDDLMTRKAIEHRLTQDNYDVKIATNGQEAIDILSDNRDVDIVLSDIHMPRVTGLELVEHIRNKLRLNIPIIMLTRVGIEATVLKAFELGADDYITKPFSPDELSLRIKKQAMKIIR